MSLAMKGHGSVWRVWQQRPSNLAWLQKDVLGGIANLVGEGVLIGFTRS